MVELLTTDNAGDPAIGILSLSVVGSVWSESAVTVLLSTPPASTSACVTVCEQVNVQVSVICSLFLLALFSLVLVLLAIERNTRKVIE